MRYRRRCGACTSTTNTAGWRELSPIFNLVGRLPLFQTPGHPELPIQGVSSSDRSVQRDVYYRAGYYWEDGQWSTGLSGNLNMPLPFTKGFGSGNEKLAASRSADAVAERADWDLQTLLNKVDDDAAKNSAGRGC